MPKSSSPIAKNVLDGFATKVILVVLKLIILVLTAKLYGADGRGIFITVLTLVGLSINLSNFGFGDALLQRFAKQGRGTQNYTIFLIMAVVASSAIGVLILQISLYFQRPEQLSTTTTWLMHLLIPLAAVELLVALSLRGLGFHHFVNRLSLLSRALLVLFLTFALFYGLALLDYFLFWYLAVSVLAALTSVYLFFRVSPGAPNLAGFLKKWKIFFWRGLRIYPINILMEFENRFDVLLLVYLSDPGSVGAYVTGVSFAQAGFYASNALTAILTTSFGSKAEASASDLAVKGQRYAIASVILINIATLFCASSIVFVVLGEEFYSSVPVMLILSVGIVADASTRVIAAWSKGQLVSHKFIKPSVLTLFFNFVICLVLLETYGIFGLAVGSSIGYFLRATLYLRVFRLHTKNRSSIWPSRSIFHDIIKKVLKFSWSFVTSLYATSKPRV